MLWSAAFVVLVLALLVPVLAVVWDAPFLRRRREGERSVPDEGDERMELLARRLLSLEDEVDDLPASVRELRDEVQDLQRAIDAPQTPERPVRISPPST
jgi:uncharacterized protein YlxW (UPF0749 family)